MQTENIKKGWKKVRLGEILNILTDYHANGSYEKLKENVKLLDEKNYAIMIRTTNFEQNNFENFIYINEHAYNHLEKSKVYKGDIIMNKIANAGSIYLVPDLGGPVSLAMNLFLLRFSKLVDQKFMYYSLKFYESYLKSFANGTATKTIRKDVVRDIEITIPESIQTQQKIASILSKYDDLIENNTKRIKILEQTAQEIYKEWFVNFRFPGYENVNMVDSGTEFGEIPEEWEVKELGKICDIIKGISYKSDDLSDNEGIEFINLKCFNRGGGFRTSGLKKYTGKFKLNQKISEGDLVMAITDMTQNRDIVARVAMVPRINNIPYYTISCDVIKIEPDEIDKNYLYYVLRFSEFSNIYKMRANGANVLHLRTAEINDFLFLNPDLYTLNKFIKLVNPIIKEIDLLNINNTNLKQTRDMLIPKLVSGEVEVDDLDIK